MKAAIDFEAATDALWRLQHGDALATIAHAAGHSTREYAARLLDFLAEHRATVEAAARGGGQVFHVNARESVGERYAFTPGGAIVTRDAPAEPAEPLAPRILRTDVRGHLDPADLRPGEVFTPRGELP